MIADLIKGFIKGKQMLRRDIFCHMGARVQKLQMHLQRRVAEQSGKLCLGFDLGRHQIEDQNLQRTNILCCGTVFRHNEDILTL